MSLPIIQHNIFCTTMFGVYNSISALPYETIQTKPLSIPNTTNKLSTTMNIDKKSNHISNPPKNNHSATEHSANNNFSDQVTLVSDPKQCQKNTTTHMTHQKIHPSKKEYIYIFLTDGRTPQLAQCKDSEVSMKVVENIISMG